MGFAEAVKVGLNKFYTPYGRASRSEFWWYFLFLIIISGVIGVIGGFLEAVSEEQVWIGIILQCFSALLCASIICAEIRRLHDIGKSGWNVLWSLIPLIGGIYVLILLCKASQPEENQYGPLPR